MPGSLNVFRWNVYSENGEDGVIEEIFRRLGVNTGWFCEFGAWDGRYGSNSYKLLRERWHGIMIEGNPARFQRLLSLQGKKPDKLVAIETFVGWEANDPNKLDHILARTPIPQNFEFLSVDIDGFDYQVWEALNVYRPLVVLIEIDSSILPGIRHVYSSGDQLGTSFTSMVELGQRKGYTLVAHTGNMFFVADEIVANLSLPSEDLGDVDRLFSGEWVNVTPWKGFCQKLKNVTPQRLLLKLENAIHEGWPRRE